MSIVSLSRFAGPPHVGHVDVDPVLGRGQRRDALRLQVGAAQLGQLQRQLVVRHGDLAALLAVDDRDRHAPVALPAQQPVAQPEVDGALAGALLLQQVDGRALRLGDAQAVDSSGARRRRRRVDRRALAVEGLALAAVGRSAMVRTIGRPMTVANSQSRWSPPGTAMIAPVP